MLATATPIPSSAAASLRVAVSPSLELLEARRARDTLAALLRREHEAMADFLVALADFDRRRGWEALGHANLFAFLHVELGLSPAPTYWRQEAARLLQRFPDLATPLRRGDLCLTTMAELAKVLTEENGASVLPRFLGISSREAKEIVAELQPREAPATRTMVTRLPGAAFARSTGTDAGSGPGTVAGLIAGSDADAAVTTTPNPLQAAAAELVLLEPVPAGAPPSQLWAPKVDFGGVAASVARRNEVEPLSADRSRIHVSVSRQFTRKLEAARHGLGHSIPNATMEQVLEAALDLLLEKQARARGLVKRPRKVVTTPTPGPIAASTAAQAHPPAPPSTPTPSATSPAISASTSLRPTAPDPAPPLDLFPTEPPPHRRAGPREAIPAAVRRAVWQRDGGCCSWPLDGGGVCGSTHRLELDHVVPWARWGGETVADLRMVCHAHNSLAARQAFGERCMERYAHRRS